MVTSCLSKRIAMKSPESFSSGLRKVSETRSTSTDPTSRHGTNGGFRIHFMTLSWRLVAGKKPSERGKLCRQAECHGFAARQCIAEEWSFDSGNAMKTDSHLAVDQL